MKKNFQSVGRFIILFSLALFIMGPLQILDSESVAKEEADTKYSSNPDKDISGKKPYRCDDQNIILSTSESDTKVAVKWIDDSDSLSISDKNDKFLARFSKKPGNIYQFVYKNGNNSSTEVQLTWPDCQTLYTAKINSSDSDKYNAELTAYRKNLNIYGFVVDSLEKGMASIQIQGFIKDNVVNVINKEAIVGIWHKDLKDGKTIYSKGREKYISNADDKSASMADGPAKKPLTKAIQTYSQVLKTYPADAELCGTAGDIIGGNDKSISFGEGTSIAIQNGQSVYQCYGTKLTAKVKVTLQGKTYKPGTKLTVDKHHKWIEVSSWD